MRKLITIVISFILIVCAVPMFSTAAEIVDSGTCGENVYYTIDEDGVLIISGNGDIDDYRYYGAGEWENYRPWTTNWHTQKPNIQTIIIENGVTHIGDYAFFELNYVQSITIPESVTSIGSHAFENCSNLNELLIPAGVTEIGDAFCAGCNALASITIPATVSTIGESAFSGCRSLSSINIPNGVTKIEQYTFYNCTGLTNISMPEALSFIGDHAFSGCLGLSDIDIPDGVTKIEQYAFSNCAGLTSISIPEAVTSIEEGAFSNCTGLSDVSLSNSLTIISDLAFSGCASLSEITLPTNLTEIYSSAFSGCTGLTEITIPDGVISIGGSAFSDCADLTSITIPKSVTNIYGSAFSGCTSITDVYYGGLPEDWNNIYFGSNNESIRTCSIHYHEHTYEATEIVPSTLYTLGYTVYTCTQCGDTYTQNDTDRPGDVNGDGEISTADSRWALRAAIGLENFAPGSREFQACDVIQDGKITAMDARAIFACAVGQQIPLDPIAAFSCEETGLSQKLMLVAHEPELGFIDVDVVLQNCTGLEAVNFEIDYDDTFTAIQENGSQWHTIAGTNWIGTSNEENAGSFRYTCFFLSADGAGILTDDDVTLLTLRFGCLADGTSNISLRVLESNGIRLDAGNTITAALHSEHVWNDGEFLQEPTCTQSGEIKYTCIFCGYTLTQVANPLGHAYEGDPVAPTCTMMGYTDYICSRCGDSYTEYLNATGHLDRDGNNVCDICSATLTDEPQTPHEHTSGEPIVTVSRAPTCTAVGEKKTTVKCAVCGQTLRESTEQLPALGHSYTSAVTAPTCTDRGYTTYTCARGDSEYIADYVDALGHADANGDGYCDRCSAELPASADDVRAGNVFEFLIQFFKMLIKFFKGLF